MTQNQRDERIIKLQAELKRPSMATRSKCRAAYERELAALVVETLKFQLRK